MSFQVVIAGHRQVQRMFAKVERQVQKNMKDAIRETAKNVRRQARRNLAANKKSTRDFGNYTRETAKGIRYRVRGTMATVSAPFPAHIIEGGADPGFFPPPDVLEEWAEKKLGDRRLAFVVGRSIEKYGLSASPFFNPAVDKERKPHQSRVEKALLGIPVIRRG